MLIHQDALKLQETYNIKLSGDLLVKLEDAQKNYKELLVTIAASHYGLLNGNKVIYRHNTVKNNIGTFISPDPKPIITNHRPTVSKRFGRVIAVDYKLTDFAKEFEHHDFDSMSTEDYIQFCKDELIPYQKNNPKFDGLGYVEVVGKIDDAEGIRNVLSGDFKRVSIGADPVKLVCSCCLKDQMVEMCEHYSTKDNDVFFLAEELKYEELSFLTGKKNPADPGAKVTTIHDEQQEDECDFDLGLDLISAEDFFKVKLADSTKTIVCADNICKIVNQEERMARKTEQKPVFNISYVDEFTTEELSEVKLTDSEDNSDALKLTDEVAGELKNSDFAIVQKTEEGTKRRFPIHDAENVAAAVKLFDKAKDLSPSEVLKAKSAITKAAKKFGVEATFAEAEVEKVEKVQDAIVDPQEKTLESVVADLQAVLEKVEEPSLQDGEKPSPLTVVFGMLQNIGQSLKWAGDDLKQAIDSYLKSLGQEAIETAVADSIRDEVQTLKDDLQDANDQIELLDEMNRDLNMEVRQSKIDEIIDLKTTLGVLKDSVEDEKAKLVAYPYNILVEKVNEFRDLKATLKDGVVNNKHEVKTVIDPTLTDSDNSTDVVDDEGVKLTDEEGKLSEADIVDLLIRGLRAR